MRIVYTLVFFLLTLPVFSQDLTGIWRGSFVGADNKMTDLFNLQDRYKYEVQIDQHGKTFNGVTYSYKRTEFYGKASSNGTINPTTGKVVLQELKLLELKMASSSYACWMICFLQYSKNGDEEFLEGKYSSYRETDSSFCGRGTVYLRRVVTSDFYKEPFLAKREKEKKEAIAKKPVVDSAAKKPLVASAKKLPSAATDKKPSTVKPPVSKPLAKKPVQQKPPAATGNALAKTKDIKAVPLAPEIVPEKKEHDIKMKEPVFIPLVLKNRENEVVQTINVKANEISIRIYDNGTIDHDTVSVYLDKKLVVSHQMLTTTPITLNVKMDENSPYHELVMVADNLGDIPPNTSLMVVKAGDKQYEVRITSTEQKNAMVIFKYDKP
ncbi:MAG TPA: hypothetical protein VL307_14435 [Chitinophagaceae bacterium]|nr:hypothetical protein [Chitinophagaceae bacterium]